MSSGARRSAAIPTAPARWTTWTTKTTIRRSDLQPKIGSPEPIAALNRVKILEYAQAWETREPLVDIRAYCPGVFCNEGICPYLRRSVADMLNHAQNSLPPGYRLKVGTALRTLAMQQRGWNGYMKRMREEHPDWPLSALRRATNKYHAPYDQKAPPGHCTGGAVDVHLIDPAGTTLDMVAPTQGWEAVDTFSDKISPEARASRMLMVEAMLGAGFSNCRDEYWHYSWGDSAWAVRVGESECPYGWTYAPPIIETVMPNDAMTEQTQNKSNPEENKTEDNKTEEQKEEVKREKEQKDQKEKVRREETFLTVERDRQGKPIQAGGTCDWRPDSDFRVHLLWTNGIPVTLRVTYKQQKQLFAPETVFYIGDGKEAWETVPDVRGSEEGFTLHLTPAFDRATLTTRKPELTPIPEP